MFSICFRFSPGSSDPTLHTKYQVGFSECMQEVSKYLASHEFCDVDTKIRLLDHLANCVSGFDSSGMISSVSPTPLSSPESSSTFSTMASPESTTSPSPFRTMEQSVVTSNSSPILLAPRTQPQIFNNISVTVPSSNYKKISTTPSLQQQQHQQQQPVQVAKVVSGLQVIPTKLASGEIAFVLPANVVGGAQVPNYVIPMYTSPGSNYISNSAVATIPPPQSQSLATTAPSICGSTIVSPHYNNLQTCMVTTLTENINLLPCSTIPPSGPELPPPGSGLSPLNSGLSPLGSGGLPPGSGLAPGSTLSSHVLLPSPAIPAISTTGSSVFALGQHPRFLLDNRIDDVAPVVPPRSNVNDICPVEHQDARDGAEEDGDTVWRPW